MRNRKARMSVRSRRQRGDTVLLVDFDELVGVWKERVGFQVSS
jgi:hypothetical protein